jgi:Zn-dependent peptidase ImmA (M78 family)/transcriptional regulator with XRE-family HTH domain
MPRALLAFVEPTMLAWARTSANLTPQAIERKISVGPGTVEMWEAGDLSPTVRELRAFARATNRPLAAFYLSAPPTTFETLRDFRRRDLVHAEWSASLHAEYRRAIDQRDIILEIAEMDDEALPDSFPTIPNNSDDGVLARVARDFLLAGSPGPLPASSSDEYRFLSFWTTALETRGVLVMNTEGGRVDPAEMRAFSMYFEQLPVIMLNGADWPRGRLFSLLHEYAHLVLHTSGLCDTSTDRHPGTVDRRLEARCNAIAAEILMPAESIGADAFIAHQVEQEDWSLQALMEATRPYGVSAEALLLRLVTLGYAPRSVYEAFRRDSSETERRGNRAAGGNFYATKARDLGKGYVRTVADAHRRGLLDTNTAAKYLGVKVTQVPRLASAAGL